MISWFDDRLHQFELTYGVDSLGFLETFGVCGRGTENLNPKL